MGASENLTKRIKNRKLPTVDAPAVDHPALGNFLEGVKEHLRMYEGDSGAPRERFVTIEELETAGIIGVEIKSGFALITETAGGTPVAATTSTSGSAGITTFAGLFDTSVDGVEAGQGVTWNGSKWVSSDFLPIANKYDMLYRGATKWAATASVLQWNPDLGFMQFNNEKSINWLDATETSAEYLVLDSVGADPLYSEVVLLSNFNHEIQTPSATDWGNNARNSWVGPTETAATNANMLSTGIFQAGTEGPSSPDMQGFDVSPDGLHVIHGNPGDDRVYTYTLDTAYDFENATLDGTGYVLVNHSGSIQFTGNPNVMCSYGGSGASSIWATYTLDAEYAITSDSTQDSGGELKQSDIPFGGTSAVTHWMSADGKHALSHATDPDSTSPINQLTIYHWVLRNAYSISPSSRTLHSKITTDNQAGLSQAIRGSEDGKTIYIMWSETWEAFNLSTAWDMTTAIWQDEASPITGQAFIPEYAGTLGSFTDSNDHMVADGLTWYIFEDSGDMYKFERNYSAARINAYTDESSRAMTADQRNQANIQQVIYKFGQGAASFTPEGGTTYTDCIKFGHTTADSAAFSLAGGEDFTFEAWVYFDVLTAVNGTYHTVGVHGLNSGNKNFGFYFNYTSSWRLFANVGTTNVAQVLSEQPVINTWYHCALQRRSGKLEMLFNGVREYNETYAFGSIADPVVPICIGGWDRQNDESYVRGLEGKIDSVRFSIGTARYGDAATYDVPTAIFPSVAGGSFDVGDPAIATNIDGLTTNIRSASTDIDGSLNVDGASTLVGALSVEDAVSVGQSLAVQGLVLFDSTLQVESDVTVGGALVLDNSAPKIYFQDSDATADEGMTILTGASDEFKLQSATDVAPHTGVESAMTFTRTGTAWDDLTLGINLIVGGASTLAVRDSDDNAYVTFNHDGTNFRAVGTGTTNWNISGMSLINITGALALSDILTPASYTQLPVFTDAELNAVGNAVNTAVGKIQGAMVYNSSQDAPVWAVGASDADVWVDGAGTTVNTPV